MPVMRERLLPGEAECLAVLARTIGEWQHAHPHEIAPVDSLVALGDRCLDALQRRSLRGPVAARAGPILLAGQHHQRCSRRAIALRRIEDRHHFAGRKVNRPVAFLVRRQRVLDADVAERPAHHHFMVPAASTERVPVGLGDAVIEQIPRGRSVLRDGSRRRDVVGGHRVAEHGEDACAVDVLERSRLGAEVLEERRLGDVRALGPRRTGCPRERTAPARPRRPRTPRRSASRTSRA